MGAREKSIDELRMDRTFVAYQATGMLRAMVELLPPAYREQAEKIVRDYDEADAAMDAYYAALREQEAA